MAVTSAFRVSVLVAILSRKDLPPARRQVLLTLISGDRAPTYRGVAQTLGIHVGTVYRQLRSIRLFSPNLYADVMHVRAQQLARRHLEALKAEAARSAQWH